MRLIAWGSLKAWCASEEDQGRRRAIVAVARNISVILHCIWIDGAEFGSDRRLQHDLT
jgi:hypothetical protein